MLHNQLHAYSSSSSRDEDTQSSCGRYGHTSSNSLKTSPLSINKLLKSFIPHVQTDRNYVASWLCIAGFWNHILPYCIPCSSQISNLTVGTYNILIHSVCTHRLNQHVREILYRFNLNRSSAVISFDGITNSLPLAIFKAPITSSAASLTNLHVLMFFSSNGMYCGIPLNGNEETTELPLPLGHHYPLPY